MKNQTVTAPSPIRDGSAGNKIHFVYWWSNQASNPPVIFAGEVSKCGTKWIVGSRKKGLVTCNRCLDAIGREDTK